MFPLPAGPTAGACGGSDRCWRGPVGHLVQHVDMPEGNVTPGDSAVVDLVTAASGNNSPELAIDISEQESEDPGVENDRYGGLLPVCSEL